MKNYNIESMNVDELKTVRELFMRDLVFENLTENEWKILSLFLADINKMIEIKYKKQSKETFTKFIDDILQNLDGDDD